jgi:3-hydroxyisobutyrate dehydrogenase-like beta-hydroxyacid dehydrogenase
MTKLSTIAVLMPGDMGHAIGRVLREHGHDVITCLDGRGDHTRTRALRAGFRDVGSLDAVVAEADLILSILPPSTALDQARLVADCMAAAGRTPVYADCNAVSPKTSIAIGEIMAGAGAIYIDGGIIGLPPRDGAGPRIYVSGPEHEILSPLNGKGFEVIGMGPEIGQASAMKMTYAALTKGTWTLHLAILLTAEQLGVSDALIAEFADSQPAALKAMRDRLPFLPADSARWVGEMEEIASTFANAGVTPGFHDGAAEMFRLLARTPFASETRDDMDRSRTLEEALAVYRRQLPETS